MWERFQKLSRRRQVGMDINPLSYQELDAFCRFSLIEMSAWEADLIMRLDDAALSAMRGGGQGGADAPSVTVGKHQGETIPVDNVVALRETFAARAMAVKASQGKR